MSFSENKIFAVEEHAAVTVGQGSFLCSSPGVVGPTVLDSNFHKTFVY